MTTLIRTQEGAGGIGKRSIPRRSSSAPHPLSFAQQRLWFLNQLEPGSPAYNQPKAIRLKGFLDQEVMKKTLDAIVARHEVLHTIFPSINGEPLQLVDQIRPIDMAIIDLSGVPQKNKDAELERLIFETRERPFDLSRDPMMRATLIKLDSADHVLLLVIHHIATDGWSNNVLFREVATLYDCFSRRLPSALRELPIQYADFSVWQRERLQGEVLEAQISYWENQLSGLSVLELPTDRPRPLAQTFRGARQFLALPKTLTHNLRALGRQEGVTLFMTLLAAFQTLLHRHTGREDIAVGSPIANRTRSEIEELIGFFVNTLVLRTSLSGNPTFRELLARVRKVALGAYEHQDLPFEKLVEELHPDRSLNRTPFFQVMFNLQNRAKQEAHLPGLTLSELTVQSRVTKFDLSLSILDIGQELTGAIEYSTDLFDDATIDRLLSHFQVLLQGIVENPAQRLSELPMLTGAEREELLVTWNDTRKDYPKDKCIHQLFEERVEQSPDAVAAVFEDDKLTYRELNRRANQLAHYLKKLGVGPEVLVGLCMTRSLEMVAGLLAILKAGGAYVPLDPGYPKERLAFTLADSGTAVLLTQQRLLDRLPEHKRIVSIDLDWEEIAQESESNPISNLTVQNSAYVIYTSGTTGNPKGVVIEHESLVNYLCWLNKGPLAQKLENLPLITRPTFDASLKQLFAPLLRGGQVWILSDQVASEPRALLKTLSARTGVGLNCVPSLWKALLDTLDSNQAMASAKGLSFLFLGGEQLNKPLIDRTFSALPHVEIWNLYGPTETTANASIRRISSDGSVTLGHPIANTRIYILDSHLQPLPIGLPGELYIGGVGLARGYINRPDLTAENFIPNPFSNKPGARLYKTGDMGRYRADGTIEFLGRLDHQVKIRGFRVELGEIETVLNQNPAVRETVITVQEDEEAETRLVAYVVPNPKSNPTASELRSFLKSKLPDHMLPSAFVFLDTLPLTSNGKVNRHGLPAPDRTRSDLGEAFVSPRTAAEKMLAGIWCHLLKLQQVGVHDNFFELGGHSLLATQVVSRLRQTFQVDLALRAFFENPTVAGMAAQVVKIQARKSDPEIAELLTGLESLSDEEANRLLAPERGEKT